MHGHTCAAHVPMPTTRTRCHASESATAARDRQFPAILCTVSPRGARAPRARTWRQRAPSHWLNWLVRLLPGTCVQAPSGLLQLKQLAQLAWLVLMVFARPRLPPGHCDPLTLNPARPPVGRHQPPTLCAPSHPADEGS